MEKEVYIKLRAHRIEILNEKYQTIVKTHTATAIGVEACNQGTKVKFYRTSTLVNKLNDAQTAGNLGKMLRQLFKLDLLICDEWVHTIAICWFLVGRATDLHIPLSGNNGNRGAGFIFCHLEVRRKPSFRRAFKIVADNTF